MSKYSSTILPHVVFIRLEAHDSVTGELQMPTAQPTFTPLCCACQT